MPRIIGSKKRSQIAVDTGFNKLIGKTAKGNGRGLIWATVSSVAWKY
jgi:hypothetical protein